MAFKILPEEQKEPTISADSLHRLPAQAIKGGAAVLPGIFGDVASLLYSGAKPIGELITGKEEAPYEKSIVGKLLPTTETHKKNLEEGFSYLKPKNEVEKFVGDIGQDTVSLFLPAAALAKIGLRGTSALKALYTSLGANAAGAAVQDLTGDETKGAYAKMGVMFLGSAINKPGVQKEISGLYQKADQLLPANATTNASRLSKELTGLQTKILAGRQPGDLAASERFVVDQADVILRQIQNGEVNVNTLKAASRSLNENLQKAVYEAPDKSTRVRARSLAKGINKSINGTLADYGKTNPEWWQYQKGANEAFGASQQSNFISNFIKNNIVGHPAAHGILHAFGIAAAATPLAVPYQGAKIIYQIAKSKELAKHYARVVASAAAEDAPLMNKEMKKLDDELKKKEKEKPRFKLQD